MKVNNKRNGSHHLPCLSGLSQAPLIGDTNERLTPISSHSLTPQHQQHQQPQQHHLGLHSPNRIFLNQAHQQQTKPICGTPNFCASSNSTSNNNASSIFFPALPPKNNLNKFHLTLESSACFNGANNHDTRKNIDLNMNEQAERNRENPTSSTLFVQDENYHLYHEPIDLDDQPHVEDARRAATNMVLGQNNDNRQPPPLPSTPRCAGTMKDWPSQPLPPRPSSQSQMTDQRSPNFINHHERAGNMSDLTHNQPNNPTGPAPFSDRAASFRNDVADDVYFRYITLKSAERSAQRTRSYHGPVLNGSAGHKDPSALNMEPFNQTAANNQNFQFQSVSPAIMSPSAVPFRDHCIRELIETESNYVHALEMMIACFAKPLEIWLKREDNQLIFGHVRYFHHIHTIFQGELVKAAFKLFNKDLPLLPSSPRANQGEHQQQVTSSNPTTPNHLANNNPFFGASPLSSPTNVKEVPNRSQKISTCFLNMKEKFLKYGEYCASLSKTQALLDELSSKNDAIAAQLDRCQQEANEGKFKLRDLLSLPMQRILKYHLLLAQLIKNSSASNDDYQGLKRAHEAMVDLGQYINEVKRDTETTQIMNEIEQSIVGLNLPPNTRLIDYGRLVTDGFIRIKAPQESKAKSVHELTKIKLPHDTKLKQKRYVFVFDKVILMCKLSGVRRYQYKEALVLAEFELESNPAVASDPMAKHSTKDKWAYSFNLYRACDRTTYSFYAKTLEMKNKWINAIQRAMDNTRPAACRNSSQAGHEFLMHTFEKASSCDHCGKLLLGLYYQGYRCRICFTSVHKKCLGSVRACGPALPPRSAASPAGATFTHSGHRSALLNEPHSPSIQSNHSDNGHAGASTNFSPSHSSSAQCMDELAKNDYNNLGKARLDPITSSSFRESGARSVAQINQRPVSSMINVSLQNSTNHLIQQKRLLRGSTSSPSINRPPGSKALAIQNFDGDERSGEMRIACGDTILLSNLSQMGQHQMLIKDAQDGIDGSMSKLNIGSASDNPSASDNWLFGRNLRTGCEGRFPSLVVESIVEQSNEQGELNSGEGESCAMQDSEPQNSYVNFPLGDQPWFNDRMDRDQAQAILEMLPHGTFLVRVSPKHHNSYVISLKYQNKVMHMRIYVSKDNQLYLSQNRYFNSIVELVTWYQENSLVESFNMLDARLATPYKHH